jgi:hypothetical protein
MRFSLALVPAAAEESGMLCGVDARELARVSHKIMEHDWGERRT